MEWYNPFWPFFYHSSSTDQEPNHEYCPQGEHTWCKYVKHMHEKAKYPRINMPAYKHEKPIILPHIAKYVKPAFVALGRRELLEKCIRGATQNTNESFHNVIWSIASKTHFIAKSTMNTAVHLAAARYNSGHCRSSKVLRSDNWEGGQISCDRFFQGYGPRQDNAQC